MKTFFFLTNTIKSGATDDPAKMICRKYAGTNDFYIWYGEYVSVCAMIAPDDTEITEIVAMKTRQQIIDLVHPNLPDFNGQAFVERWEELSGK